MTARKKYTCCISNCNSSTYKPGPPNDSYHQFPSVESRRLRWLEIIINIFGSFSTSLSLPVICSKHFKPDDYVIRKDGRPQLKASAEPSIFLATIDDKSSIPGTSGVSISGPLELIIPTKTNPTLDDKSSIPGPSEVCISGPSEVIIPTKPIYCQTNVPQYYNLLKQLNALKIENKNLKKRINIQNEQLQNLCDQYNDNIDILDNIKAISFAADNNDPKAIILLYQLNNFLKKEPTWSETTEP